jgi:hypothetical protein
MMFCVCDAQRVLQERYHWYFSSKCTHDIIKKIISLNWNARALYIYIYMGFNMNGLRVMCSVSVRIYIMQ